MKIIDRYVLGSFIRNYLISFMVLIGMYVALDMVFNFGSFSESTSSSQVHLSTWKIIYDIADYYFYQCFVFFVQLSGMIAAVAAAFTLMRLSRFNETTALLAAGTPLLRIALSVILAGVALNFILLPVDREILIPRMTPKLNRSRDEIHQSTVKTFPVRMMQDNNNGLLTAGMYYPASSEAPAHIDYFDVIERDSSLRAIAHLYASAATWNNRLKRWDLADGQRVRIGPAEASVTDPIRTSAAFYQSDLTPDEIALNQGKDYIQLLPTSTINQLLTRNRYGTINLLRTKHARFTQPIANVILLLLAISKVLTREPGRLKTAAAQCMGLMALFMGSIFIFYQLAGNPNLSYIWPAILAWVPILIFGPLAVLLLDRVKS